MSQVQRSQHTAPRWQPGEQVMQIDYDGVNGKLVEVRPAVVVADTDEHLALYFPQGSTFLSGDWMNGRERYGVSLAQRLDVFISPEPLTLEAKTNSKRHVLSLLPHGALHAFWFFWDVAWQPTEWFVNFQAPYLRTAAGIKVRDYYLDLALTSTLQWSWKDRDEFDALVGRRLFAPELVEQIETDAAAVIDFIAARAWPYTESWADWRPDPSWPTEQLHLRVADTVVPKSLTD